ncbi:RNA processing protein [Niveomyces insectorum RCEF 264]|uniref:Polynucleotide 5'-hydroxyl-kinase GRC3 n=1 Tax=Niveomyces insectorum RCEF 264 TaxID=1081102 RepID=A0A167S2M5_9HYPO|nr:RNA processing protein [Niveomyces insectorum RCEF 264]
MAAGKKRKLDPEPSKAQEATKPPALSAFALRKRLLQQKEEAVASAGEVADAATTTPDEQHDSLGEEQADETTSRPASTLARKQAKIGREGKEELVALPSTETSAAAHRNLADAQALSLRSANASSSASAVRREAPVLRSSFRPTKQNCQTKADGSMLLTLTEGDRLVIFGSYGLTVQDGALTLAGASLRASTKTHWVHAPQCHALPVLRCAADDATVLLEPHPAAPALRKLETLSPVFARLWNGPTATATSKKDEAEETFQILYTSEDGPARCQDLVSPPEWNKLLAELSMGARPGPRSGQPVFFVCGPKSSGKSTFSRILTNRLLTDNDGSGTKTGHKQSTTSRRTPPGVAVLDLDPGQPEYGPPGTVSLLHIHEPNLSPPFCHPYVPGEFDKSNGGGSGGGGNRVVRSHALMAVSSAADPEHYLDCVMDLFAVYQRDLRRRCGLVVNTPGWVQGTGLDILRELVAGMRPARVIYMSQDGPEDTVHGLRSAYEHVPLVELPSQPGEYAPRTAAHLRTMQTASYFHVQTDGCTPAPPDKAPPSKSINATHPLSWDATPLTAMRPWVVPYTGPDSGILGVMCYDHQPSADLLADAINGTVISIVAIEHAAAFRTNMDVAKEGGIRSHLPPIVRSPEGIPVLQNPFGDSLDPRFSRALGAALVRGIDAARGELQLLTPLPAAAAIDDVLRHDGLGVALVSGKLDLPTWAYTEELYAQRSGADDDNDSSNINNKRDYKNVDKEVDTTNEDTDDSEAEGTGAERAYAGNGEAAPSEILPWVEMLQGGEKRTVGSRVWRVRRDLGRNTGGGGGGE